MSEVHVKEGESLDSALKRFKRSCAKAGVLAEVRRRECYESPSVKRRKKSEAARKNRNKRYYSVTKKPENIGSQASLLSILSGPAVCRRTPAGSADPGVCPGARPERFFYAGCHRRPAGRTVSRRPGGT